MHLLNTSTLQLTEFMGSADQAPRFAILSHTWEPGNQEVTFQDITQLPPAELWVTKEKGFAKIQGACRVALSYDLEWIWIDTCCIDKTSSAELTEAINSMFAWYSVAHVCFVYLSDLIPGLLKQEDDQSIDEPIATHLSRCRWLTRGWTLQELIAPRWVEFFSHDWTLQGNKVQLSRELSHITRINEAILRNEMDIYTLSVAERMSWAATRQTTRQEDEAYCLLGIFDVHLPLLYGEGSRAFIRLQEEIIRETNDLSLFAWKLPPSLPSPGTDKAETPTPPGQCHWGLLAPSPAYFVSSNDIELWGDPMHNNECVWTSKGLRVTPVSGGGLSFGSRSTYLLNLQCHRRNSEGHIFILLEQHGCDMYVRVCPDLLREDRGIFTERWRVFYIKKTVSPSASKMLLGSHKHAVDFTRVIWTLKTVNRGLYLNHQIINSEGYWDHQRSLWLMQGGRNGDCNVEFRPIPSSITAAAAVVGPWKETWSLLVKFQVYNSVPKARLVFVYPDGRRCDYGALGMEEVPESEQQPDSAAEPTAAPWWANDRRDRDVKKLRKWLSVSVVNEVRDGFPVYMLTIEKGPAAEGDMDVLDIPRVKEMWK